MYLLIAQMDWSGHRQAECPPEIGGEIGRRLVPLVAVLGQRLGDDPLQFGVGGAGEPGQRVRLVVEDGMGYGCGIVGLEGKAARDHLVENDPQGEDVGPMVDVGGPRLLGRHVEDRAQGGRLVRELGEAAELGHPEVQDPHVVFPVHEEGGRLHVPVDDPGLVGLAQALRDLDGVAAPAPPPPATS